MGTSMHRLTVGMKEVGNEFFLSFKAVGKLTHEDYELITPIIDTTLEGVKEAKVKVLIDASEFEGWELRAAWDDFRLGLKYNNEFEKIAIYGKKEWLEIGTKIGSWFLSGEIKYFENYEDAVTWLSA